MTRTMPAVAVLAATVLAGAALGVSPAGSVSQPRRGSVRALQLTAAVRRIARPASTGEELARPAGAPIGKFGQYPKKLAFSPDSKVLATADADGAARLWDVATRRQIGAPITVSGAQVLCVAFSPDGKTLATANSDGTARLWDVATRRQIGVIKVSRDRVMAVTFSPGGKILATDTEFQAQLWDVATQRQTGKPIGAVAAGHGVFRLAFSPDSKILATVGNPTIRLWNVATHQRIGTA